MSVHNGPNVIENGLVLCLDAGDSRSYSGSGTTEWTDRSGLGNNGTLVNGVGYNAANRGGLVFDGVNDYVDITENQNMRPQILTAEAVFRCISTVNTTEGGNSGNSQFILFRQNSRIGNFEGYTIVYNETTQSITAVTTNSSGVQRIVNSPNNSALLGNTVYITAVFDSTLISLYVNGNFQSSGLKDSGIDYNNSHTLKIGRALAIGNLFDSLFNGNIFTLRIYNRALSADEIKQNFEATRSRFGI